MTSPSEVAEQFGRGKAGVPAGSEVLQGFAVMSLPFASGDVLCLRSWFSSSFGPAYESVWHRSPSGNWTVYHSVPAELSCPRFVGAALSRTIQTPIDVRWTGPDTLSVRIENAGFTWDLTLGSTGVTHLMNGMLTLMPAPVFRNDLVLSMMGLTSTALFAAGRFTLRGGFPNRQWFKVAPRRIWMVTSSRASLGGRDFGEPRAQAAQPSIGDIPLPQKGVLMVGGVAAEAYSATRHLPAHPA